MMNTNATNQPMPMTGEAYIAETRTFERGGIPGPTRYYIGTERLIDGLRIHDALAGPFNTLAEASAALTQAGAA